VEDYKNNRNGGGAHGESYAEGAPWSGREGEMSETEFSASVKQSIDDAVDYIDGFIAPARAKATSFYRGDPFGNEEEGRSQIVMTELRDVTQAVIPSLLRIFTASENVVEYMPRNEATVEMAEQATDYVNFIFYNDNPGFQVLHNVFKDALVRKTGIIKWRWSEDLEISEAEYTGLDLGQVAVLESDPEVEIVKIEVEETIEIEPDPMTGMEQPPIEKLYVRIRRSRPKNRVVIEAVPPEEFLISRDARNLDTAMYVGHRSLKTMSELVAMGYDRKEVEEYAGQGDVFSINTEAQTRNPAILSFMNHADNPDGSLRRVIYVESYVRIDKDGDGIAELRKVCSIGNAHHILHDEVATDVPFCVFCPDPEPHMIIGQSLADQVNDLQVIKSAIVRNTMDSLAQVIHPRTVVVEGQVNLDDVMNTETGAIIRARQPGMVQALSEPFVGQAAMPIIQYMDEIRAQRTGITQASQGLDPDVLQSTTAMAVSATVQGAQERIELIARIFAENGMKRLFRGLLRMVCRHQDHARVLRLRGKWVNIDPRYWDADMDVSVNVAFGHGSDQDRMQFMLMLAQKQEQIMQLLGPSNPLCDISQYRAALAKITELAGIKDVSRYFNNVTQQQAMQMAQQASQNKPPDPNQMLVQIEQQKAQVAQIKAQADVVINQQKLDIQREEAIMQDARERERIQADAMLKAAEIQAKYGSQVDIARLERMFDHDREVILAQIKADSAERQSKINAQSQRQNVPSQYDPR
jgi:hypothetical protein